MTDPPVLALDLLYRAIVHEASEYPRDHFLVVSKLPLEGRERDRLGARADGFADPSLSLRKLEAVGAVARREGATGGRHGASERSPGYLLTCLGLSDRI